MTHLRRITAVLIACLAMWTTALAQVKQPVTKPSVDSEGYFLIASADNLAWVADYVNTLEYAKNGTYLKIRFVRDITMENSRYIDPIGGPVFTDTDGEDYYTFFSGEVLGEGHTLRVNLNPAKQQWVGLFGRTHDLGGQHTVIRDLVLDHPVAQGKNYVGSLVGEALGTDIINVTAVNPVVEVTNRWGGGIVGTAISGSSLTGCATIDGPGQAGHVSVENSDKSANTGFVGGIVGNTMDCNISDCFNSVAVYCNGPGSNVGGIAGSYQGSNSRKASTFRRCGNTGTVSGSSTVEGSSGIGNGGLVGQAIGSQPFTFEECYNAGRVNGPSKFTGRLYGVHYGSDSSFNINNYEALPNTLGLVNCAANTQIVCYTTAGGQIESDVLLGFNVSPDNSNLDACLRFQTNDFDSGVVGHHLNAITSGKWMQQTCDRAQDGGDLGPVPTACTLMKTTVMHREGIDAHHALENGNCEYCGTYYPAMPAQDEEGYYLIGSKADLEAFAIHVNALKLMEHRIYGNGDGVSYSEPVFSLNARLTADIDCAQGGTLSDLPHIGDNCLFYNSHFDGQGHTISGFRMSGEREYTYGYGLIGHAARCRVTNLKVDNAYISAYAHSGAVVGKAIDTDITDCYVTNRVRVIGNAQVGGIVGQAESSDPNVHKAVIERCTSLASVENEGEALYASYHYSGMSLNGSNVGGVAGAIRHINMTACYNAGKVFCPTTQGTAIGGLVGDSKWSDIVACGNFADVNAEAAVTYKDDCTQVGGLVGYGYYGSINACFSRAQRIYGQNSSAAKLVAGGNNYSIANCAYLTGLKDHNGNAINNRENGFNITHPSIVVAYELSDEQFATEWAYDTFVNAEIDGLAFAQTGCSDPAPYVYQAIDLQGNRVDYQGFRAHEPLDNGLCHACGTQVEEPIPGVEPSLGEDGYYVIKSVDNLLWFRYAVNHNEDTERLFNARLTRDLDISACLPWTSIGTDRDHKYMGHFDGQGHTISGMRGDSEDPGCSGFFGYMWQSSVTNLTLRTPATVGGSIAFYEGDAEYLGLIAGRADQTTFSGVNAEGYVRGTKNVGGLLGYGDACDFYDCHYTSWGSEGIWGGNAYRAGDTYYVGGIAAYTQRATFVNCTVEGKVSGGNMNYFGDKVTTYIGGILGQGTGGTTISCCAMTGSVYSDDDGSANSRVGGLVGNHFGSSDPLLIDRSYVFGDVDCGSSYTGTLIGFTSSPNKTERCAYNSDSTTPGIATGYGTSAMDDSVPAEGFTYDEFANGTAAAHLGAPWGHSYGIDEMTGDFSCPDWMTGEQYPVLGGVPFYYYWDSNINDLMATFVGDLNGNGSWDAEDVDLAGQLVSGKTLRLTPWQHEMLLCGGDFNGDGHTTIADVTALIDRLLHIQQLIDDNNHGGWEPGMGE